MSKILIIVLSGVYYLFFINIIIGISIYYNLSLQISKIPWLHPLKDTEKKWIIILKLLHWFLAQYIIKILHKYIVLIPIKRRWVYIRKDVWHQMQYTFINEKVKRGDLISYQGTPKIQDEITFIKKNKLLLSSSGLRLVVMYIHKFINLNITAYISF